MPAYKLPIIEIEGKQFTVDDRLRELRPIQEPYNPFRFDNEMGFMAFVLMFKVVSPFLEGDDDGTWKKPTNTDRFSWLDNPDVQDFFQNQVTTIF